MLWQFPHFHRPSFFEVTLQRSHCENLPHTSQSTLPSNTCSCFTVAEAERSGDEELVKELRPQKRYVVWILDRKDIEKGVQLWSMPQTVDRDICKISRDRQTQEIYHIDHPYQGYDISFDKEGEKILTKYVGFQLARRPSSVDEQYLEYITRYPLNEILIWRDATEIQGFLDGANGGKSGASAPAPDTRREPPRQTAQERPVDRLPPPREEAPAARREPPSEPVAVRSEPAPARREAPPFADPDQEFLNKLTTPEPQTAPSTAPNTPPPNRPTTIDKPPISDRARQLAERFAARQSGG